jgi:hypothetical protein
MIHHGNSLAKESLAGRFGAARPPVERTVTGCAREHPYLRLFVVLVPVTGSSSTRAL